MPFFIVNIIGKIEKSCYSCSSVSCYSESNDNQSVERGRRRKKGRQGERESLSHLEREGSGGERTSERERVEETRKRGERAGRQESRMKEEAA